MGDVSVGPWPLLSLQYMFFPVVITNKAPREDGKRGEGGVKVPPPDRHAIS